MQNKNEFPRGHLNPIILTTLLEKDKYGYEIIEEIKQKTGIEIKQPSLYSSLKRMETQKYISSYWQDSDIGGKRHYYCLTAIGGNFLKENPVDFSIYVNDTPSSETEIKKTESEIKKSESEIAKTEVKEDLSDTKDLNEKSIQESDAIIKEEAKEYREKEEQKETPRFAQQDNIFKVIKEEVNERIKEEVKEEKSGTPSQSDKNDGFVQYDLFANIKSEEVKPVEVQRIKNMRNKNSNDPYQLKHFSEEELKSEFEKIRNQKFNLQNSSTVATPQSNIWMSRESFMKSQSNVDGDIKPKEIIKNKEEYNQNIIEKANEGTPIQKDEPIQEETPIKDDGKFITERINIEEISRPRYVAPPVLNIESTNYPAFLSSKSSNIREDKEAKEKYQQKITQMFSKRSEVHDYNKSLEKLESKIEEFSSKSTQTPAFDKVENTYERVKNSNPVFKSYKSL